MTEPVSFHYQPEPLRRCHGPAGYESYQSYKPWLRDDFDFRCVYCLERELWYPDRSDSFSADHVVPRSEDADLTSAYTNLLYACTRCNTARGVAAILNPTRSAMGEHVRVELDGTLIGLTGEGRLLIDLLQLNEDPALAVRRKFLVILALKRRYPADSEVDYLYRGSFGYPADMPDLRVLRPPGGNTTAGSERDCHFARRERGELPDVF